jgi:lipopolysaccharide/colanic/teichoic acid biosynthesis glycosyltransferase
MNAKGTRHPRNTRTTRSSYMSMTPVVSNYFRASTKATIVVGVALLAATAPLIAVLCVLVKLTSRGPAFYRQVRVGKHGKPFVMLKMRTMYQDAEHATGPTWCVPGDSRITPLGAWLRFLHLDELPQLVNVVRGEMALVGPRPERPEIIEAQRLEQRVPGYAYRSLVLPGVTGLAQVNLPSDQTIKCVSRKLALDIEYIETGSLSLDVRIVLCTALRMLGLQYGLGVKLLGLSRKAEAASLPDSAYSLAEALDRQPRWDAGLPSGSGAVACIARNSTPGELEAISIAMPKQPR